MWAHLVQGVVRCMYFADIHALFLKDSELLISPSNWVQSTVVRGLRILGETFRLTRTLRHVVDHF
jgi:hypothetical protein